MSDKLSNDQRALLELVPDRESVGNGYLRSKLRWGKRRYFDVRNSLVPEVLELGKGRGGSVRRANSDVDQLLAVLPRDGTAIANPTAREALGWEDDRYWAAQLLAREQGLIAVGRGRGGTLRRADVDGNALQVATQPRPKRELDMYEPIRRVLEEEWAKYEGLREFVCRVTALQGKRKTGGIWTRPDITLVSFRNFSLLPGAYFDIYTFEVKRRQCVDITGVHEAVAHGRFATRPYALFEVQPEPGSADAEALEATETEARRLGVGLILAQDIHDFDTWTTQCVPERREPDPRLMQEFLEMQLDQESQDTIREWLRG